MKTINKAVLAYSGGLDTSIILKWLRITMVVRSSPSLPILAREEVEPLRQSKTLGVRRSMRIFGRNSFGTLCLMFRANTLYEGEYLLGTSIARPLIARHLVRIAEEMGADAISHGATGKGNDQFVLS